MLTHWIIGMFGASLPIPTDMQKFRKLMLGLKNKGGAWTSELLILLLHDITVFYPAWSLSLCPLKEDALCYYCIFSSLRFDQTFFLASAVKSEHLVPASLVSHRDLCSNRDTRSIACRKPQAFVPVLLWRRQCLICLLTRQSHPTSLFSLLSTGFHLLKQNWGESCHLGVP